MKFRSILLAAVALAAVIAPAAPAVAQEFGPNWINPQFQGQREERREQRVLTVRQMLGRLRAQLGEGEAIAVSPLQRNGDTPYYVVEWRRPDGQSRSVRVNAVTGNLM